MKLFMVFNREDELSFIDVRVLNSDAFGLPIHDADKLRDRPPQFVAISEFVSGAAR